SGQQQDQRGRGDQRRSGGDWRAPAEPQDGHLTELLTTSLSETQSGRLSSSSLIRYALEFCGVFQPSAIANPLTLPSPPGRGTEVSTHSGRESVRIRSGRGTTARSEPACGSPVKTASAWDRPPPRRVPASPCNRNGRRAPPLSRPLHERLAGGSRRRGEPRGGTAVAKCTP